MFIFYTASFIIGTFFGSFINVLIYRIPKRESIVFPGSHCTLCGYKIPFYDNIPILSYLILGGKCRNCRARISIQYPIVELMIGVISLLLFMHFGLTLNYFMFFVFSAVLFTESAIDFKYMLIADGPVVFGIIVGVIGAFYSDYTENITAFSDLNVWQSFLGMLSGYGIIGVIYLFYGYYLNFNRKEAEINGDFIGMFTGNFKGKFKGIVFDGKINNEFITDYKEFTSNEKDILIEGSAIGEFKGKGKGDFIGNGSMKIKNSQIIGKLSSDKKKSYNMFEYSEKERTIKTEIVKIDNGFLEAIGEGDAVLLALIGVFLGVKGVFLSLFIGAFIGAFYGIFKIVSAKLAKGSKALIPFGPFLSLGAFVSIFYDDLIIKTLMNYIRG